MATDLTAVSLRSVNGESVVAIADATLKSGASMLRTWDEFEPIVRDLTTKLATYARSDEVESGKAARLLSLSASVVQKLGQAAQGMLRTSEGLSKLSLLLDVGRVKRRHPSEMTQKELAGVLVETLKKLGADGPCPVCHAEKALPVG